jgi:hypothetical protein
MQYSPKLKKAMEEIKAILKKHDVGGVVILHTPGHSEYLHKLDPSYSCAKVDGNEVRIRAKLQEDFKGDKDAWYKKVRDTVNMFNLLASTCGNTAMSLFEISQKLDSIVDAEHTDLGHSSHTDQNN